jgi:hypothetical protein
VSKRPAFSEFVTGACSVPEATEDKREEHGKFEERLPGLT